MNITRADISSAFDDLISGARTRESIAEWAGTALQADDKNDLKLSPEDQSLLLWRAIKYLVGVDLRVSETEYLHCNGDFREYREKLGI